MYNLTIYIVFPASREWTVQCTTWSIGDHSNISIEASAFLVLTIFSALDVISFCHCFKVDCVLFSSSMFSCVFCPVHIKSKVCWVGLVSLCIVIAKKLNNNLNMTTHEFINNFLAKWKFTWHYSFYALKSRGNKRTGQDEFYHKNIEHMVTWCIHPNN